MGPPTQITRSKRSPTDKKKPIASVDLFHIVKWHIYTILSVSGTLVLVWLNLSHYDIGGEIGSSSKSSADIIGALQLVTKLHEILIVASLANIARQLIVRHLLTDGIVLGLLGAEAAFTAPSFIVSAEYLHALRFGFGGLFTPRHVSPDSLRIQRKVFGLALFIFWACVLSSLAGPSSAVLMIPRVGWSCFAQLTYTPNLINNIIPSIMISSIDEPAVNLWALPSSNFLGLEYWDSYFRNSAWNSTDNEHFEHAFQDHGSKIFMNVTGSYSRQLSGTWDGGTEITGIMRPQFYDSQVHTRMKVRMEDDVKSWKSLKTTINVNGLSASVTCRDRAKIPCPFTTNTVDFPNRTLETPSSVDWCYMSVHPVSSFPTVLRSGSNLVLAADYGSAESRVWVTEGPRIVANPYYSDTIEVVVEGKPISSRIYTPFELSVCSFSAELVSGIGTATGLHNTPDKVEYFDHILLHDGSTIPPRKILFHEDWIDIGYFVSPSEPAPDTSSAVDPPTFPPRPRITPPGYNLLGMFGNNTRNAGSRRNELGNHTLAAALEVTIGGELTFLLSWVPPTSSQYAMSVDRIPSKFTDGLQHPTPESLLTGYVFNAYREGYIFRLDTRTGYLGLIILLFHAVTAIVGSLWQIVRRKGVVLGWMNTPEYTMLGAGSAQLVEAYPNTGAGIKGGMY